MEITGEMGKKYDEYIKFAYQGNIPSVQYTEMRKSFFAGASTFFNFILKFEEESKNEDEAAEWLEVLQRDVAQVLEQYMLSVEG